MATEFKFVLQFEVSLGNAGNTIDGQVQTLAPPSSSQRGSLSGQGDTDSHHSVNIEDAGKSRCRGYCWFLLLMWCCCCFRCYFCCYLYNVVVFDVDVVFVLLWLLLLLSLFFVLLVVVFDVVLVLIFDIVVVNWRIFLEFCKSRIIVVVVVVPFYFCFFGCCLIWSWRICSSCWCISNMWHIQNYKLLLLLLLLLFQCIYVYT